MTPPPKRVWYDFSPAVTTVICAVLLALFAAVSYNAALTKSATWDEPEHLLGSYLHRFHKDFRVNPEDPALFGWIASLPMSREELKVFAPTDPVDPARISQLERDAIDLQNARLPELRERFVRSQLEYHFRQSLVDTGFQWPYVYYTLYDSGNDPDLVLHQSRAMGTLVGVLLGATIAWWAYRLGGSTAAIIATAFYAFCPNFMAHASLVKNDVMLSAAILGLMFAIWRFGRRGTILNLAAAALLAGAAVSVKYSGVMAGPFVVLALLVRAILPQPWEVMRINLTTRLSRIAVALGASLVIGLVAYGFVWAVYGFRYAPTPDPHARLNMPRVVQLAKENEILAPRIRAEMKRTGASGDRVEVAAPTPEEVAAHEPSAVVRLALWFNKHHLLPHAWVYGFIYTYKSTLIRSAFLLGEIRVTGWWYFFPLAMLFKTPLATLVAMAVALLMGVARMVMTFAGRRQPSAGGFEAVNVKPERIARSQSIASPRPRRIVDGWSLACLAIAPAIYGISAMTTNLNLGLRHVLPLYPFIFIGIALVLGSIVRQWPRVGAAVAGVLLAGLAVETFANYPHYIAFFNAAAGGRRGGVELLGDSNLDWGQDLPLLRKWQDEHPDTPIYFSYFGMADPEYYGLRVKYLPSYFVFHPTETSITPAGVIAVSATNLQGIYVGPKYRELIKLEPAEVLGGTIYLYRFPLASPSGAGTTAPAP